MDDRSLQQRAAFDLIKSVDVRTAGLRLVNSLGALDDIVRWRKQPRGLSERILDGLTGRKRRLDGLFDGHATEALGNLYIFASDLREHMVQCDIVLAKTATRLRKVSDALDAFRVEASEELSRFDALLAAITGDVAALGARVQRLEAQAAVDRAVIRLNERHQHRPLTVADLWLAIDELWWGDFGVLLRHSPDDARAHEVAAYLFGQMGKLLRECDFAPVLPVASLLSAIPPVEDEAREGLELLALDPDWAHRPLSRAVLARSLGEGLDPREAGYVPRVTSPGRMIERLLDESKRATE